MGVPRFGELPHSTSEVGPTSSFAIPTLNDVAGRVCCGSILGQGSCGAIFDVVVHLASNPLFSTRTTMEILSMCIFSQIFVKFSDYPPLSQLQSQAEAKALGLFIDLVWINDG